MAEREHRVREIAHRLWEEEGRPSDQEKRHWATAERMLDAEKRTETEADANRPREEAGATGTGKRRAPRTGAKRTAAAPQTSATH